MATKAAAANAYRFHWNTYRVPHSKHAKAMAEAAGIPGPAAVVTYDKAQRIREHEEVWADPRSVVHRLPDHFKHRYWMDWVLADLTPVHYRPPKKRWEWDERRSAWLEVEHRPIIPIYPPEADRGLWGGEGIVKGFFVSEPFARKRTLPRNWVANYWWPKLQRAVLYSECLNSYMTVIVTPRLLNLVDDHFGLDLYLMSTRDPDLHSALGRKLKREAATAVAEGLPAWQHQPEKQALLMEKYADYAMPLEEAEWVGLSLNEAARKQQDLEEAQGDVTVPLQEALELELVEMLRIGGAAKEELTPSNSYVTRARQLLPGFRK